jgi:hypothetical protein
MVGALASFGPHCRWLWFSSPRPCLAVVPVRSPRRRQKIQHKPGLRPLRAKILPKACRNLPSARFHFMKMILTLAFACTALFLAGCGDQSLLTDEEYNQMKGPAAYPSDPTRHIPQSDAQRSVMGTDRY